MSHLNGSNPINKASELWRIVQSLQQQAGGGTCKAVTITLFFDARGKPIGKSKCKVVPLYPSNLFDVLAEVVE